LNISKETTNDCQLRLTVEVEPSMVEQYLRRASRRLAEKFTIPGFRKGKAPYDIVVRMLGKEALYEEALDELSQEVFSQALKQEGIEPFAQAHLEDVSFEPMVLTYLVPLPPQVVLNDYRAIRVETEEVTVDDEAVDRALEQLREEKSEWHPVQRPLMVGDMAVVDMRTISESESFEINDRAFVIKPEDSHPVPGFYSALIGMEAGETRSFTLTYPADWDDEGLAGRPVDFEVTLKEVHEKKLPELNDEFAVLAGDYDSLAELREAIRRKLAQEAEDLADREIQDKALEQLVARAEIAFPPVLVEKQLDAMMRDMDLIIRNQEGVSLKDYLKMSGLDMQVWRDSLSPEAEKQLRQSLALSKLAEMEHLTVTDEEQSAQEQAMMGVFQDDPLTIQQFLATPQGQSAVRRDLISRKAIDRLIAIAKGQAPELEAAPTEGQPAADTPAVVEGSASPSDEASQEVVEVTGGEST